MPDLCTKADLKAWLSIAVADAGDDALLTRLVSAVSADFLKALNRYDLTPEVEYTEVLTGDGSNRIVVRHWPVNSVTTLTVDAVDIAESTDGIADGYVFDADADPERRISISLIGSVFTLGKAVTAVYKAGYAVVPADIVQAVIEWAAYRYRSRQWIGQQSKHMQSGEVVQFQNVLMPETTKSAIERYNRLTAFS